MKALGVDVICNSIVLVILVWTARVIHQKVTIKKRDMLQVIYLLISTIGFQISLDLKQMYDTDTNV